MKKFAALILFIVVTGFMITPGARVAAQRPAKARYVENQLLIKLKADVEAETLDAGEFVARPHGAGDA